jgi:hypothetical protein
VDDQEAVVQNFDDMGYAITGLPTLLLAKNGKIICSEQGLKTEQEILLMIGKYFDLVKKGDDEMIHNDNGNSDNDKNDQGSYHTECDGQVDVPRELDVVLTERDSDQESARRN